MNVWHLVLQEIAHRKLNFALVLLSVSVAVACLVGTTTLLQADRIKTETASKELQDEMRKITKKGGFNVLILSEDQDLKEFHVNGTLSKTIPEGYVGKLANSKIVTVNHLLPMVTKRMIWPEKEIPVIVIGTRGEVPLAHRDPKKPLLDHVPKGTMMMGHLIAQELNIPKVNSKSSKKSKGTGNKDSAPKQPSGNEKKVTVTLMGREFTVTQVFEERGTTDDSTVWINLTEAQEMLGLQNLLHGILALECNCAAPDRVAQIRAEIQGILPGTQVIERGDVATVRAEARNKAKQVAVSSMEQHESFTAVLLPLVLAASMLWIAFLTFNNVRQRNEEIGILRAIGFRSSQILSIFLGKAILVGFVGAGIGYAAGFVIGAACGDSLSGEKMAALFLPSSLLLAIVSAPLLSALAGWIPAMLAARQDPAIVLQGE